MRIRLLRMLALPAASILLFGLAGAQRARAGDLIVRSAAIYTLDAERPWASALLIRDGRIAYVGDDAGALALRTPGARVLALDGRMLLPGLHDSHMHPMSGGMHLLRCGLDHVASAGDMYAAARSCAARKPMRGWVLGNGWSPRALDARTLDRARFDRLVPQRPALFASEDGFLAWVNARALAAAGIDPDGAGAELAGLQRDPVTHRPTGIVEAAALEQIRRRIPKPGSDEYRAALRAASALANRYGITSVFDANAGAELIDAYRAADRAGELSVRVVAAQSVDPRRGAEQVDALIARRDAARGTLLRADAAKIFLDGEIDMHTAAMLAPYADSNERGELLIGRDALDAIVRRLDAEGFSIHMHAMGDAAVRAGLDAIEHAERVNGARDRRHQLAHIGVADDADIGRFGALGVAANFTPVWFQADDPASAGTLAALGPQRARRNYPIASIAAAGGRIAASSDWPSPSMDPLLGMQVGLTRQPEDGGKPPLQPDERVDLAAIIRAYTSTAAWLAREETLDGSIRVGNAADLVVLDRNLFDVPAARLREVRVLCTLLDGRVVYRHASCAWPAAADAHVRRAARPVDAVKLDSTPPTRAHL